MILESLKNIKNLIDLSKFIKSIYQEQYKDSYIPAVISHGEFSINDGEDFYLKLVLAHQKLELTKTWIKNNMIFGIKDPDFDQIESIYEILTENVITHRKVKGNSLYQLNPNIMVEEISNMNMITIPL